MIDDEKFISDLYLSDEYINKNPSLHEEESDWKISKIVPLVDRFIEHNNKDEINLLDVGGGTGLILYAVSNYFETRHSIGVNRYALDLSPGMLEIQKERNPDLRKALNEDIRKTSLSNKEIDLALLIDVLEHVPNPIEALEELRRISSFSILNVPLENSLDRRIWNFLKSGEPRKYDIETYGHINFYTFGKIKRQIEKHTGRVLDFYFTNKFHYWRNRKHYKEKTKLIRRLRNFIALHVYSLSPRLCSILFHDSVVLLVKCY
jgi:ubiquinone/menaquinone biosynthesis C-methylase UbiE